MFMVTEKILSIGIPVYNMEKYLSRCIKSLITSSYLDKLDIIIVNDGSKDKSLEIANEIASQYPESIRVIDKQNGGWGTAINSTIENAKGKYFKNLDSDDWFDSIELDKLIKTLNNSDEDIIYTSSSTIYADGNEIVVNLKKELTKNKKISIEDFLKKNGYTAYPIHCVCYKTEILKRNAFTCLPRFYGDLDYIQRPLKWAKTVKLLDYNIYKYFIGREGQSINLFSYRKNFIDLKDLCVRLSQMIESVKDKDILLKCYLNNVPKTISWLYYVALSTPKDNICYVPNIQILKEFDTYLKKESKLLYKLTYRSLHSGIPYICLWRFFNLNIFRFKKK